MLKSFNTEYLPCLECKIFVIQDVLSLFILFFCKFRLFLSSDILVELSSCHSNFGSISLTHTKLSSWKMLFIRLSKSWKFAKTNMLENAYVAGPATSICELGLQHAQKDDRMHFLTLLYLQDAKYHILIF